jgi:septation ring formation regulator EzrA
MDELNELSEKHQLKSLEKQLDSIKQKSSKREKQCQGIDHDISILKTESDKNSGFIDWLKTRIATNLKRIETLQEQ